MRKKSFLIASIMMLAFASTSYAQPTLSTLYGEAPNKYTKIDTITNSGYNVKVWKFTDLVKNCLTFQLDVDTISGNGGGYWWIYRSIFPTGLGGASGFCYVAKIDIAKADSSYSYTILPTPTHPAYYYKTVYHDTGTTAVTRVRTASFYR